MPKKPEVVVYEGLAQVAHAIRRSTAVYVAMNLLPQDASMTDLAEMTEEVATIIRGKAPEATPATRQQPLGEPFYEEPQPYSEP